MLAKLVQNRIGKAATGAAVRAATRRAYSAWPLPRIVSPARTAHHRPRTSALLSATKRKFSLSGAMRVRGSIVFCTQDGRLPRRPIQLHQTLPR